MDQRIRNGNFRFLFCCFFFVTLTSMDTGRAHHFLSTEKQWRSLQRFHFFFLCSFRFAWHFYRVKFSGNVSHYDVLLKSFFVCFVSACGSCARAIKTKWNKNANVFLHFIVTLHCSCWSHRKSVDLMNQFKTKCIVTLANFTLLRHLLSSSFCLSHFSHQRTNEPHNDNDRCEIMPIAFHE